MNNLDPSSDLLWPYTYTFLSLKSVGGGHILAVQSPALSYRKHVFAVFGLGWFFFFFSSLLCFFFLADCSSMASSLYSQSLISTYSLHALHTARRRSAAEGYLPDKLLRDAASRRVVPRHLKPDFIPSHFE